MRSVVTNAKTAPAECNDNREIVISRVFDAPRAVVWSVWTQREHLTHWWGPRGFTTTVCEMDLRPGGSWKYTMHGPDGTDYPTQCIFIEVARPERIVYSISGGKKDDRSVQSEVTWTFEVHGKKTKVTLRMLFPAAEAREYAESTYGVTEGGKQTLDRFAEHLAKSLGPVDR